MGVGVGWSAGEGTTKGRWYLLGLAEWGHVGEWSADGEPPVDADGGDQEEGGDESEWKSAGAECDQEQLFSLSCQLIQQEVADVVEHVVK